MRVAEIQTVEAAGHVGERVRVRGHIHAVRRMGNLAFVVIRDRSGTIQAVAEGEACLSLVSDLSLETPVVVEGIVAERLKAMGLLELKLESLEALVHPPGPLPVEINKENKIESLSLAAMLDYRPLTLRNPKVRAIFKIEAAICAAFREYLTAEGFTEIHSSKLVSTGTEGGAQLFSLDYFGRRAYLAQSPQFYKQIMVGVFERVFEVGPVFRAEEHDTTRHLNEYVSLDYEMGFIESEQDVIAMQVGLLKHIFARLDEWCPEEMLVHGAIPPSFDTIPQVTLEEAAKILQKEYGWKSAPSPAAPAPVATEQDGTIPGGAIAPSSAPDLDPEGERLLCQYFLEKEGIDLVYVTRYPRESRPFYTMPLEGTGLTRSFDLLFRGLEITTGGQRTHSYEQLTESMRERGLNPEAFSDYLQCFRYGMPPHGGLAIGLERLTKQLLGLTNVKLASLFPRDLTRLTP